MPKPDVLPERIMQGDPPSERGIILDEDRDRA